MPAPLSLLLTALLLHLGAFALLTVAGRRMGTAFCGAISTIAAIGAFTAAVVAMMHWLNGGVIAGEPWGAGRGVLRVLAPWYDGFTVGLQVDSLTIVILTAGLLVSAAIHVFTTGYLRHDIRGPRVFALMSLADAALVGLMTSASLPQWAAWVVLTSIAAYLLATPVPLGPGGLGITPVPRGLTASDLSLRALAALTMLILRTVGDGALLITCGLLARPAPGLAWGAIWAAGSETAPASAGWLLIVAAVCHASVFPVCMFLPDAKGYPTPAAALAYAVTVLPTGALLLARVFPILSEQHLLVLSILGGATLLVAGVASLAESDMRRWLAWTVTAGMGAVFAALGAGSLGGALLQVLACMLGGSILLLSAGSILHACYGERRFSHYGGLLFRMPASAILLALGAATLLGGPVLAGSGAWNTMLSHAYRSVQAGEARGWVSLCSLGGGLILLGLNLGRGWSLLLMGRPRDRTVYDGARESATLTVPVAMVAVVAIVAGSPIISPVRQLVTVIPMEMALVVAPDDPGGWTGARLTRDVAPPEIKPPPAPEDDEARVAIADASVPPDDRIPRLVDPVRWVVAGIAAMLGALLPRTMMGRRKSRKFRWRLSRGLLVSRQTLRWARKSVGGVGLLASAAERFVLDPCIDTVGRLLFPVTRPRHAGNDRGRLVWTFLTATVWLGAVIATIRYHALGPGVSGDRWTFVMNGAGISQWAVLLPAAGTVALLGLWLVHGVLRGLRRLVPEGIRGAVARRMEPALGLLPPRGRSTRAVAWCFLFVTLLALLALPAVPDPWMRRLQEEPFFLEPGRWLVAVAIAVVALCAAITAWEDESAPGLWAGMLALEALCLGAVSARQPEVNLAFLDAIGLLVGLLLATCAEPHPRLIVATRRWLLLSLAASAASWAGLSFPSLAFGGPCLAVGLLLRCGIPPGHTPVLVAHERAPTPLAMLLSGAVLPAGLVVSLLLLPALGWRWQLFLTVAACWAWTISARQLNLRRTTAAWSAAAACLMLGLSLTHPSLRDVTGHLLIIGLATAGTIAVFVAGVIKRDFEHVEIGRLGGVAARMPGAFGWMTLALMALAGAPPFVAFSARLLATPMALGSPIALFLLVAGWTLGAGCGLTVVHRVFLGLPRRDVPPLDLSARERLVLLMLAACCIGGSLAPATLFRPVAAAPVAVMSDR